MRPLKKEIEAVAALLAEGGESPEDLAARVIEAIDKARDERVTYAAVLRFGQKGNVFMQGFSGYSTKNQAVKALEKHPALPEATGWAIVPLLNDAGFEKLIASVDAKPEVKGDWSVVAADREAFKRGEKPRR